MEPTADIDGMSEITDIGGMLDGFMLDDIIGDGDDLEQATMPAGRALRRSARLRYENMLKKQQLADVVGVAPAPGESIHIVSNGQYDFWTWAPQILAWIETADELYCSTWTLGRNAAVELFALCDAGQIAAGRVAFLTGLYFKRRDTAVYSFLLEGLRLRGGRYVAFTNHCKVLLLSNAARDAWLVVEGSANLNRNPRFEQYVVTNDRRLYEFHRQWMEEALDTREKTPPAEAAAKTKTPGFSARRAGLGVLAATKTDAARRRILAWKAATIADEETTADLAAAVAAMVRHWIPTPPAGCVITAPPQGASFPGEYFAEALARRVAEALAMPFAAIIARTDDKARHGPQASLQQTPFTATAAPELSAAIVIDDLITSGTTMRLSLAALQTAGLAAYGFAYNAS